MATEETELNSDVTQGEDPASLQISDLEKKIIRQVEYYFGDVNLPRDKFLKEKITEDNGWVTIECLTTFNRLKCLSTDLAEIANALKKSKNELLEINESEYKVRRSLKKPLPNAEDPLLRKASRAKTLHIKGFPETYAMDEIQDFFTLKLNTNTVFLKMKRDDEKKFKGSIFVELPTQEEADKLINNKELKCEESQLTVMLRDEYFKQKDAKKKGKKSTDAGNNDQEENKKFMKKPGAVLHFKGAGEGTSREDLKKLFGEHQQIAWVDFNRGETEGFIRFQDEGAAQQAIDAVKSANDNKIVIKDVESEVRVLEGEEEDNYWETLEEDMQKQKNKKQNQRGRGRGHRNKQGGADKHIKRKRKWENDSDSKDGGKNEKKMENNDDNIGEHKRFDSDNEGDFTERNGDSEKLEDDTSLAKKAKVEE